MTEARLLPVPKTGKKYDRAPHRSAEKLTVHRMAEDPVAPRAVEAQKIAEAGGGVAVDAALELGLKARQREKRHDQAQHAHGRDAPGRQDGGAVGTMGGLIARQREHAGAEDQRDDRRY